jgi:hypothetical protein
LHGKKNLPTFARQYLTDHFSGTNAIEIKIKDGNGERRTVLAGMRMLPSTDVMCYYKRL